MITPAKATRGVKGFDELMALAKDVNQSPTDITRVHAGNMTTPAKATRGVKGFDEVMALAKGVNQGPAGVASAGMTLNYSPNVTIQGDVSPATREEFAGQLKQHAKELERIMIRKMREAEARA
jgi:hypothetical protein